MSYSLLILFTTELIINSFRTEMNINICAGHKNHGTKNKPISVIFVHLFSKISNLQVWLTIRL